jgi:hypothetical protein
MFYGSVAQYWQEPGVTNYEHEYQYYVDLLDPEVGVPWPEKEGGHYWLNIQALFEEDTLLWPWGWKISEDPTWASCPSAVSGTMVGGPWQAGRMTPPVPGHSNQFDLAFELTTDELGPASWYSPIVITDIAREVSALGTNRFRIDSLGDWEAGWQYLQVNTDLVYGSWSDLQTNPVPLWPPDTNYWYVPRPRPSPEFYRIQQR